MTPAEGISRVKELGLDYLRLPVRWSAETGPSPTYTINSGLLDKVEEWVDFCIREKKGIIVDIHHFEEYYQDPEANKDELRAIHDQLIVRFKDKDPHYFGIELLNEPRGAASAAVWNSEYPVLLQKWRDAGFEGAVLIGTPHWNSVEGLPLLDVSAFDLQSYLVVHPYLPKPCALASEMVATDARCPIPGYPRVETTVTAEQLGRYGISRDDYTTMTPASNPVGGTTIQRGYDQIHNFAMTHGLVTSTGQPRVVITEDGASWQGPSLDIDTVSQTNVAHYVSTQNLSIAFWNLGGGSPESSRSSFIVKDGGQDQLLPVWDVTGRVSPEVGPAPLGSNNH